MRKEKWTELNSYIEELKTVLLLDNIDIDRGFLKVRKEWFQLNNGKIIFREKLIKGKKDGSAAIILPITKDEDVVLVVQPRPLTKSSVGIELPAGYIEDGELPEISAMRELAEETGYVPENIELLAKYYQDQGCSSAYNYSFLATGCEQREEQHLDNDEYIRYFKCHYQEMLELVEMGYINDANSIIAIEKSKKVLRRRKR